VQCPCRIVCAGQLGTAAGGAGQQLTLNWMVYVPPPLQRPLRVQLPSGAVQGSAPGPLYLRSCVPHAVGLLTNTSSYDI
jgi:hypothetical protein